MWSPSAIGSVPVLSSAEERQLATQIEAGLLAAELLRGPDGPPRWAAAEELAGVVEIGEAAHRRFIQANLRLVALVARPAARASGLPYGDLFQEGCLGLLVAVHRFDHRRGRFATYGLHWIRAYVGAASAHGLGASNLPTSRAEQLRQLRGVEVELAQRLGRQPSTAEIADALGRTYDWTRGLIGYRPPLPLDDLAAERLAAGDDPASAVEFRHDRPGLELLDHLNALERAVIELRMGFAGDRPHTLGEIGDRLGLTRARTRRIEQQALDRLRGVCPQSALDQLSA